MYLKFYLAQSKSYVKYIFFILDLLYEIFCFLQVDGRDFVVDVIDSVEDYLLLMKEIFNFDKLKTLLQGSNTRPPFKVLINSMHGGKVKW